MDVRGQTEERKYPSPAQSLSFLRKGCNKVDVANGNKCVLGFYIGIPIPS